MAPEQEKDLGAPAARPPPGRPEGDAPSGRGRSHAPEIRPPPPPRAPGTPRRLPSRNAPKWA